MSRYYRPELLRFFAATILIAHQFFEHPFLRLKKRFTLVPARQD